MSDDREDGEGAEGDDAENRGVEAGEPATSDEQAVTDAASEEMAEIDSSLGDVEEAFEEMEVTAAEPDEVWADVTGEDEADPDGEERDVAEVPKHEYCERCEFFSSPPEIECTNEGTDILAFVGMDTVRVADCPVVVERRGLEEGVATGSTDLGEIERS